MRFPRKNGFFSQLDWVQLFRPDSTDWEPAAIEMRNPRIRNRSEIVEGHGGSCAAVKIRPRIEGGGAGGKRMPIESREKILLL